MQNGRRERKTGVSAVSAVSRVSPEGRESAPTPAVWNKPDMDQLESRSRKATDTGSDEPTDDHPRTIHESPPCETVTSPDTGERVLRWTLRVDESGDITTVRIIPYDGERYYTTRDRWIPTGKNSQARLGVDEVLERHAAECAACGGDVTVADLRARIEGGQEEGDER